LRVSDNRVLQNSLRLRMEDVTEKLSTLLNVDRMMRRDSYLARVHKRSGAKTRRLETI
jgi:hypothetical protein